MTKSDRETMEILAAYDLTATYESAAELCGCDPKTVARYVAVRDAGKNPFHHDRRPRLIDPYLEKIEELVERSGGKIRADVVHESHIVPMGFGGDERSTRRAVAEAKAAWHAGRRRTYRPWVPEPGMWCQFDWGDGPVVRGHRTCLFCAWFAWSRYRVVIATLDRTLPTLLWCLDQTLRRAGGVPTYLLTDNERTVTLDHVAGIPVRHPVIVAAGRHYGMSVETCVPYDPETKGGSESTVKIAKADLVPTSANLLGSYESFAELEAACDRFCVTVNARPHTETRRPPVELLAEERARLHPVAAEAFTAALGETRTVRDDQTIRFGSVRYSVPKAYIGEEVFCRVHGDELVIIGKGPNGICEIARHELSTPGHPRICDEHYPDHPGGNGPGTRPLRPRDETEAAFCQIGVGAERWLREACATGQSRIRHKMAAAIELAALVGTDEVDEALGVAALAGRFSDGDLVSIVAHLEHSASLGAVVHADETYSAQPGTGLWGGLGR